MTDDQPPLALEQQAQALITALQEFRGMVGNEGFTALAMVCDQLARTLQDWLDARGRKHHAPMPAVKSVKLPQPRVLRFAQPFVREKKPRGQ